MKCDVSKATYMLYTHSRVSCSRTRRHAAQPRIQTSFELQLRQNHKQRQMKRNPRSLQSILYFWSVLTEDIKNWTIPYASYYYPGVYLNRYCFITGHEGISASCLPDALRLLSSCRKAVQYSEVVTDCTAARMIFPLLPGPPESAIGAGSWTNGLPHDQSVALPTRISCLSLEKVRLCWEKVKGGRMGRDEKK